MLTWRWFKSITSSELNWVNLSCGPVSDCYQHKQRGCMQSAPCDPFMYNKHTWWWCIRQLCPNRYLWTGNKFSLWMQLSARFPPPRRGQESCGKSLKCDATEGKTCWAVQAGWDQKWGNWTQPTGRKEQRNERRKRLFAAASGKFSCCWRTSSDRSCPDCLHHKHQPSGPWG